MHRQIGWRGLLENLEREAPRYVQLLPELPRLLHQALQPRPAVDPAAIDALIAEQRRTRWLLLVMVWAAVVLAAGGLLLLFRHGPPG